MEELLGPNGDPDFANATQEIEDEFNTIRSEESDDGELQDGSVSDEDFMSEEEADFEDSQFPAVAIDPSNPITTKSLDNYRKTGPFGKLHKIGVLSRKSSQLKQLFHDVQVQHKQTTRAWVHNIATRWSSDYEMATRALELRRALDWLFTAVEEPWYEAGAVISQRPELLSYKLTPREWSIVKTLRLVLKNFAIISKVMQGDPSTP
jgi:hypothetical protein